MKTKIKNSKKQTESVTKLVKHALKLTFVPHKKNGYNPHLIRRYGLIAIVFIVIGLQLGYNGAKTGDVLPKIWIRYTHTVFTKWIRWSDSMKNGTIRHRG